MGRPFPTETPKEFRFHLQPATVLIKAIAALADRTFNPKQRAVIQVDKGGFEITVREVVAETNREVFGFLSLKANCLRDFECKKPLRKMISLESIRCIFKDAASYISDTNYIVVVGDYDSDQISFQLGVHFPDGAGSDFCRGLPVCIEMQEINYEYRNFPNVSYGFEAVIPSTLLRRKIAYLLKMAPQNRPTSAMVTLTAPTLHMELDEEFVFSTVDDAEQHDAWIDWQYWESLMKASCLADNCCMCLVTDPPEHVMLRFNLSDLGDFVYLMEAKLFLSVPELPHIGHFQSVLNMRA